MEFCASDMISEEQIWDIINRQVHSLSPSEDYIWNAVKTLPDLWFCPVWNDGNEKFWAVGIIGNHVIWFNHVEDGFNISRYAKIGTIEEYWCNQDDISHITYQVKDMLNGFALSKCGPPEFLG